MKRGVWLLGPLLLGACSLFPDVSDLGECRDAACGTPAGGQAGQIDNPSAGHAAMSGTGQGAAAGTAGKGGSAAGSGGTSGTSGTGGAGGNAQGGAGMSSAGQGGAGQTGAGGTGTGGAGTGGVAQGGAGVAGAVSGGTSGGGVAGEGGQNQGGAGTEQGGAGSGDAGTGGDGGAAAGEAGAGGTTGGTSGAGGDQGGAGGDQGGAGSGEGGAGMAGAGEGGAGAGGEGGDGGAGGSPIEDCSGKGGSPGVAVKKNGTLLFCIDAYETTRADYAQFVKSTANTSPVQPANCSWNIDFKVPDWANPPDDDSSKQVDDPKKAVGAVNWCQAYAYCQYQSKRLCGTLGAGETAVPVSQHSDPAVSEWTYACTANNTESPYTYGSTYDPDRCNTNHPEAGYHQAPVDAYATCESDFAGIFDLNGNVQEWENDCEDDPPGATAQDQMATTCYLRGGPWSFGQDATCAIADKSNRGNNLTAQNGIRCCWGP